MKKPVYLLVFVALISGMVYTSYGPNKKLVTSRNRVDKLKNDSATTHSKLNDCNTLVKNLNTDKVSLKSKNEALHNDFKILNSDNNQSKMIAGQAKRLQNLQNLIQSQKDVMSKLKNSIAAALLNYKTDELTVYTKAGNVYFSLQEKLLFKSGSNVVDPKDKEVLKSFAQVLNSTNDITLMIESHPDNVPIKTKAVKDNWDLLSCWGLL